MSSTEQLAERLREIAARLRDPELPEEEAEGLAREAAELVGKASSEIESALREIACARGSVSTYPDDLRELVENYLAGLRFSAIPETEGLDEAMRYSLLAGGKRIRPVLALATRALARQPSPSRCCPPRRRSS